MFFDTHLHVHYPDFDVDRAESLARARGEGIHAFLNVGTDVASSRTSIQLAESSPDIWAACGIHPNDTRDTTPEDLQQIEAMLSHPRVAAVGEVGLDFYREHSPRETQRRIFSEFLKMAQRHDKPLVIHCRDAYEALIDMLKEHRSENPRGIIHCFSADRPVMEQLAALGFYISFAGPLTYKKNDGLREACRACPRDKLLLETDAPFLPPQSQRGKRNEPSLMLETARTMAELHGLELRALGDLTSANARAVLGL
ncbi:MAG: hypothetical protein A2Y02_02875 [Omnitrophica bacterium GWA2_52_12]|nr:MAG: hypothetical protein A2Y02_02875 [Omnitrophica bacterium GWA2_52_12]